MPWASVQLVEADELGTSYLEMLQPLPVDMGHLWASFDPHRLPAKGPQTAQPHGHPSLDDKCLYHFIWNLFQKGPSSGQSIHLRTLSPGSWVPAKNENQFILWYMSCLMFFRKLHVATIIFSISKGLCTLIKQYMAKLLPACSCSNEWKRNHVPERGSAMQTKRSGFICLFNADCSSLI